MRGKIYREGIHLMHRLGKAEQTLQELGFKHAPIQGFCDVDGIDGRYITLQDPEGIYYILGVDNKQCKDAFQVIFADDQKVDGQDAQRAARIESVVTQIARLTGYVASPITRIKIASKLAKDCGRWIMEAKFFPPTTA